jgi:hypothetical protein
MDEMKKKDKRKRDLLTKKICKAITALTESRFAVACEISGDSFIEKTVSFYIKFQGQFNYDEIQFKKIATALNIITPSPRIVRKRRKVK